MSFSRAFLKSMLTNTPDEVLLSRHGIGKRTLEEMRSRTNSPHPLTDYYQKRANRAVQEEFLRQLDLFFGENPSLIDTFEEFHKNL